MEVKLSSHNFVKETVIIRKRLNKCRPKPHLLRLEVAELGGPNVIRGFLLPHGLEAVTPGAEPLALR